MRRYVSYYFGGLGPILFSHTILLSVQIRAISVRLHLHYPHANVQDVHAGSIKPIYVRLHARHVHPRVRNAQANVHSVHVNVRNVRVSAFVGHMFRVFGSLNNIVHICRHTIRIELCTTCIPRQERSPNSKYLVSWSSETLPGSYADFSFG